MTFKEFLSVSQKVWPRNLSAQAKLWKSDKVSPGLSRTNEELKYGCLGLMHASLHMVISCVSNV